MIQACDGFDSYASGSDLIKKWAVVQSPWTWNATAGKFGGGALVAGTGAAGQIRKALGFPASATNYARGFWIKFSGAPSTAQIFATWFDTGPNATGGLRLETTGAISQMNYNGGGISFTGGAIVTDNLWHWIELRSNPAFNSACGFYVDGSLQGSANNGNGFGISTYGFISVPGITTTIDDEYYYDDATGAPTATTNWPVGPRQISTIRPASDGPCTFGTLSSGTAHFGLVNEVNPDGDASYCEDGASGSQDLFNMSALGYPPLVINAVVVNAYLENPAGGVINNQLVCKSGGVTTASASAATAVNYKTAQATFSVDPNTSAAWTPSGLSVAQFGYKNP